MTDPSKRDIERAVDRLAEDASAPRFGRPDDLTPEEKALLEELFSGDGDPYGETDPETAALFERLSALEDIA